MKIAFGIVLLLASVTAASAQYGSNGLYGSGSNSGGLTGTGSNPSSHYVEPYVGMRIDLKGKVI
jgi:hypothetical protein